MTRKIESFGSSNGRVARIGTGHITVECDSNKKVYIVNLDNSNRDIRVGDWVSVEGEAVLSIDKDGKVRNEDYIYNPYDGSDRTEWRVRDTTRNVQIKQTGDRRIVQAMIDAYRPIKTCVQHQKFPTNASSPEFEKLLKVVETLYFELKDKKVVTKDPARIEL